MEDGSFVQFDDNTEEPKLNDSRNVFWYLTRFAMLAAVAAGFVYRDRIAPLILDTNAITQGTADIIPGSEEDVSDGRFSLDDRVTDTPQAAENPIETPTPEYQDGTPLALAPDQQIYFQDIVQIGGALNGNPSIDICVSGEKLRVNCGEYCNFSAINKQMGIPFLYIDGAVPTINPDLPPGEIVYKKDEGWYSYKVWTLPLDDPAYELSLIEFDLFAANDQIDNEGYLAGNILVVERTIIEITEPYNIKFDENLPACIE